MDSYIPQNGFYLTAADAEEYANSFAKDYNCNNCSEESSLIRTVTFIVTENCNLACKYCYEVRKTKRRMTKEIAKAGIDMLFDQDKIDHYFPLESIKGYVIEFFGGEPFLEPDLIEYIIKYFLRKAYITNKDVFYYSMFSTTTNGTTYFDERVQKLISRYNNKFNIGITIDGNKELHDTCRITVDGRPTYEIVEKAVKDYNRKRLSITDTKLTLAPSNISFLYDALINLWENVGIQIVFANCVFEEGWEPCHATILYNQMLKVADYLLEDERYSKFHTTLFDESIGKPMSENDLDKNFCGGNGNMLAIAPDGLLYPCARFAPYSLANQPGICIGNVYDGVDKENKALDELKEVTLASQSTKTCIDCNVGTGCALCTAYNYDVFGTPNKRAIYICDMHKARVEASKYYYNKLYVQIGLNKHF